MPKVEVTNKKGLVQSPGGGDLVLKDAGLDCRDAATVRAAGGSIALKSVAHEKNVAAATTLDFADVIPADSIPLAFKVEVVTGAVRAGGACAITDIGLDSPGGGAADPDAFATGLSIDAKTVGAKDIAGGGPVDTAAGFKFWAATEGVRLTFNNAPDDTVGKVRLTVYYYQLS